MYFINKLKRESDGSVKMDEILFTDEEEKIRQVIIASRKLEEYLWGEYNG